MYGYSKETSVNVVRSKILKEMVGEDNDLTKESKIDISNLPPCQYSLRLHTYRVNHRVVTYKRANVAIFEKSKPNDENQGCSINENGILEPVWTTGSIMLQSLINLLDATNNEGFNYEEMEMESEDYESDDEDEEYTSSFMIYLLRLEISGKTYAKQYNRVCSVFLLFNDQYFLLPTPPPNSLFLAKQGKISIILTLGVALDTLYGCLQVLSTAFVN